MYAVRTFFAVLALALAARGEMQLVANLNSGCQRAVKFIYREPGSIQECINFGSSAIQSVQLTDLRGDATLFRDSNCNGGSAPLGGGSGCVSAPSGVTWRSVRLSVSNPDPVL